MTPTEYDAMPAIERLRAMVRRFNGNREGFNLNYSLEGLLEIDRAWMLCGWDFYPDQWASWQVEDVLQRQLIPKWDEQERPVRQ